MNSRQEAQHNRTPNIELQMLLWMKKSGLVRLLSVNNDRLAALREQLDSVYSLFCAFLRIPLLLLIIGEKTLVD